MIKQTIILLAILASSTLSFAQIQDNKTVDFNEGENTVELGVLTFKVKATQGLVIEVATEDSEYTRYNDQVATLKYKIEGFANEVDIDETDSIYENDSFALVNMACL